MGSASWDPTRAQLLVQLVEGETWVEAWVDTPEESDGVAVIGSSDIPDGIARDPDCVVAGIEDAATTNSSWRKS